MRSFRLIPGSFRSAGFAAAIATAVSASASGVEPTAKERWEVDYGSTKCRLIRHFVVADQVYRLEIERNLTFGGHNWALHGTGLPSAAPVTVALAPQAVVQRFKALESWAREAGDTAIRWHDENNWFFDAMQGNQQVRLIGGKKFELVFTLPKVHAAIKALATCEDDLLASWGVDAAQFRALSVRAQPSNYAGRWATDDDYPRADFSNRNEGITTFLLGVAADGTTTGCRIVGSSGFPSLDARTCELLMRRAAFHPAKDGAGNAVASFYVNTVRWQVPR